MLALADQRGAGEDDGEHGDDVDQLHHRAKPRRRQSRVEPGAHGQINGRRRHRPVALHKLGHLQLHDLLHRAVGGKGLHHARGVHVELHARHLACQHIALEVGRYVQHQRVAACVQAGVYVLRGDQVWPHKLRRKKGGGNALREGGDILVHDGDGHVVQRLWLGLARAVDRQRGGVDDEHQHHRVAPQAPQLFDAQAEDGGAARRERRPAAPAVLW